MDVFEAIYKLKTTVKEFDGRPVDEKDIGLMLYMATRTNSAGNIQPWEFIVVQDDDQKKKLAVAAFRQKIILDAPVDIVVCANMEREHLRFDKRGTLYGVQDTAAAVAVIMLTANALNLGAVWIRAFDEEEVKTILGLPDELRPVAILSIGHPTSTSEEERTPFEHISWVDKYGKKFELAIATKKGREDEHLAKPVGMVLEDFIKSLRKKTTKK
ncbi:MAG: nitroreductase family protein [Candidatus Aenigmarchaeota archaeon]|nr:nitroreductase family protein [Candidatus Aenigmarchaeota archaeon]